MAGSKSPLAKLEAQSKVDISMAVIIKLGGEVKYPGIMQIWSAEIIRQFQESEK